MEVESRREKEKDEYELQRKDRDRECSLKTQKKSMKRRMKKEKLKIFKEASKEGGKKPDGEGSFLDRVKALQVLTHPNIVTLKEVVLGEDQRLMLVYELLDKDLYKMIEEYRERKARIEEDKIRILMYQLLKGVACIHKRGYFHRDLKPENLVLKDDELLKITDFGIIKETSSLAVGPFSDYIATRWYRAPEVVLRSTNYDSGIDVWAIGCIMAEMFMLYPLFPGTSELD